MDFVIQGRQLILGLDWYSEIRLHLYNCLPHKYHFQQPCIRSLLKTLWEKKKMLVTSIFSFFPRWVLPFPIQISNFQLHLFCCLQMLSVWTSLKLCRLVEINRNRHKLIPFPINEFRLFQTERLCRRQFQIWWKWQKILRIGGKHFA